MAKIEIESAFLKAKVDVQDGDLITFVDGGKIEFSKKFDKNQTIFTVKTDKGVEKKLTLNNTSKGNLIEAYGDDGDKWIGKEAKVNIMRALVSGEMKDVIILTHPGKNLDGEVVHE